MITCEWVWTCGPLCRMVGEHYKTPNFALLMSNKLCSIVVTVVYVLSHANGAALSSFIACGPQQ